MRDEYEDYPDLNDRKFQKWLVDYFAKLEDIKAEVLTNLLIKNGCEATPNEDRVITESIMHIPLIYLYRRYKYETAKPEAERIAKKLES
jgi:hypothetical protein